jgi:hypothetical protein
MDTAACLAGAGRCQRASFTAWHPLRPQQTHTRDTATARLHPATVHNRCPASAQTSPA